MADQLVRSPAEHLGELRVAQEELAVAREGDAYRGTVSYTHLTLPTSDLV